MEQRKYTKQQIADRVYYAIGEELDRVLIFINDDILGEVTYAPMEHFNEHMKDLEPLEIAGLVGGGFNPNDDYFAWDVFNEEYVSYTTDEMQDATMQLYYDRIVNFINEFNIDIDSVFDLINYED